MWRPTMLHFLIVVLALIKIIIDYFRARKAQEEYKKANRWEKTTGKILTSGVKRIFTHNPTGSYYSYRSSNYAPEITYEYQVLNRVYRGSRIEFGYEQVFRDEQRAKAAANLYRQGDIVDVFYNPDSPFDAVLSIATSDITQVALNQTKIVGFIGAILLLSFMFMFANGGGIR
jgi:hypothetical protein